VRGADRNSNLVGAAIQTAREVYLLVTDQDEIRIQVFPIYKGKYINLEKVKDNVGLMRRMLGLNLNSFPFWGADKSNDVFAGYAITLES
jgi:hypothetical protein